MHRPDATRRRLARTGRALLGRRARPFSQTELEAPAVVVSPHFDDEVLGCGGTILRKVAAGAAVTIVHLTDGSRSHPGLMAESTLAETRQREGRAAAALLGVAPDAVTLLELPETQLAGHRAQAIDGLVDVLASRPVEQVFVTCPWESADHAVANEVARAAITKAGPVEQLLEFPVWLWARWPWIAMRDDEAGLAKAPVRAALGAWRMARHVTHQVDITAVLDAKREALDAHRSQTTPLRDDVAWPTLGGVAGGAWLECFFGPQELFMANRRRSTSAR